MSVTKRINGDYLITNKGDGLTARSNVTISTTTLYVDGNLIVGGNATSVGRTDTYVTDNILTLNKGETGAGVSLVYSGIEVDRGTQPNVQIRWNESVDRWQVSTDQTGTTFANIATSTSTGSLGVSANLDLANYSIYSSTFGNVRFDDNVAIQNTTVAPTALAGYNTIYTQTPNGGGSGLYVTNTSYTSQELITRIKSLIYTTLL